VSGRVCWCMVRNNDHHETTTRSLNVTPKTTLRGVYIATQLNSTQLNSTVELEQRTAKSVVFSFMTSRPTNWVNCCSRCRVEFSWVELCRYERAFTRCRGKSESLSNDNKRIRMSYYSVEDNYTNGHKASRGLSATAELLVLFVICV